MKKAVVAWSGGKDSCFACYKARQQGYEIAYILNCASAQYRRASAHGVMVELIARQAEALGIPLLQNFVSPDNYEAEFKQRLKALKQEKIDTIVTGDISLADARTWNEKICQEVGYTPVMPLWGRDATENLIDFIDSGFEAVVVCLKADLLGSEWLGRKIDHNFLADLARLKPEIDPCGETGEFHTFVVDGPLFKNKVKVSLGEKVLRNGYWFLDVNQ